MKLDRKRALNLTLFTVSLSVAFNSEGPWSSALGELLEKTTFPKHAVVYFANKLRVHSLPVLHFTWS